MSPPNEIEIEISDESGGKEGFYELLLYVAGQSPRSIAALANLKRICEEYLEGRYTIEVVDLLENPDLAEGERILALPTVVRKLPRPVRKLIGDLSNAERTDGYGLASEAKDEEVESEIGALREQLREAEEMLRAIGGAEVDAFLIHKAGRKKVFLLQYADMPYHILLERINEGALTINSDGIILYCNGSLARTLKLGERAVGDSLYDYVPPEEKSKLHLLLEEARDGSSRGEMVLRASDGTDRHVQLSIAPFLQEELPDAFCVIASDLAQRRQVEEALERKRDDLEARVQERTAELQLHRNHLEELVQDRTLDLEKTTEQLRALAARMESVREEERQHIAAEVHDQLGQALTGLKMYLSFLKKNIDESDRLDRIQSMAELIDSTIELVRKISTELRPGTIDLGLVPMFEWHCSQFQEMTGIKCSLVANINHEELNKEVSIALYRIFQEALTNVVRHANATGVDISIVDDDGSLVLEIADNGRGASNDEIHSRTALGILGMKERAHIFGGDVDISGESGKGTKVIIRIPLK